MKFTNNRSHESKYKSHVAVNWKKAVIYQFLATNSLILFKRLVCDKPPHNEEKRAYRLEFSERKLLFFLITLLPFYS